ncbi:BON domain-containing protein [Flavobacterium sp.]|uniref:BON domain-containing protein n=1 Tax=Flavobacterium sp. TaxID=239 RepID=UPI002630899A|nr:BON domain-containing protein [Flavobacterium sp.]
MKTNESLALEITNQIKQDPLLKDAQIVVNIGDTDVVLRGTVNKFFKKVLIHKIVSDVTGIKNINDQLRVILSSSGQPDEVIEAAVVKKFETNFGNTYKKISLSVTAGEVVLGGTVKWTYQKQLATDCISYIEGIVAIDNQIAIDSKSEPEIRERDILAAIYKDESITSNINIDVTGRKVTLTGTLPSLSKKELVEKIVLSIAGVHDIDNRIVIIAEV